MTGNVYHTFPSSEDLEGSEKRQGNIFLCKGEFTGSDTAVCYDDCGLCPYVPVLFEGYVFVPAESKCYDDDSHTG